MAREKKDKHFLHKPHYVGGNAAMKKFIAENIRYPKSALDADIEGYVHLRYDINHKGVVTGAKIISGLGYGCDEEAVRLVKLLRFKVAKNRGVRATFHKTIRIHFKKPSQKSKPTKQVSEGDIQYQYVSTNEKKKSSAPIPSAKKAYHYTIRI
ncbi:MAG TPA: energy transducer TonB [Phaeodactylibacter sp.]|nr:energy transducer TonB [Phaeodactylibacter sp.]